MKNIKKISAFVLATVMMISVFTCAVWADNPVTGEESKVLAHWKFQNDAQYFTGDIDTDTLKFIDLTGNGNDLEVAVEGNGAQLDIFTWDEGVNNDTLDSVADGSSLKFGNTLAQAQSVDPYESSLTTYSGAYVSGKYLQTVENAPLNTFDGMFGWTVEIVFKIDPEWNTNYNRYTGVFSKQGVVDGQNEPPFSMAITEKITGEDDGSLGTAGTTGLQYVHVDMYNKKTNHELQNGMINTDQWIHYMATSDGFFTYVYINGELYKTIEENSEFNMVNESFGWEVGVGRKQKGNEATMNEEHPEGLIRRLFCGSISEIRFTDSYMDIEDSLILENQKPDEPDDPVVTTTAATTTTATPTTTPPTTTPATTVPTTDKPADEKKGGCKSSAVTAICAVVATTAMGAAAVMRRKRED